MYGRIVRASWFRGTNLPKEREAQDPPSHVQSFWAFLGKSPKSGDAAVHQTGRMNSPGGSAESTGLGSPLKSGLQTGCQTRLEPMNPYPSPFGFLWGQSMFLFCIQTCKLQPFNPAHPALVPCWKAHLHQIFTGCRLTNQYARFPKAIKPCLPFLGI